MTSESRRFFVCPRCRADLCWEAAVTSCTACGANYPVFSGIPDFRVDVPDADKQAEWRRAMILMQELQRSSFSQVLRQRIVREDRQDSITKVELAYELSWKQRGQRALDRLNYLLKLARLKPADTVGPASVCLDIGCGKGVLLGTMAPKVKLAIGIEYVVEYVILAAALLREEGIQNAYLAVAQAEHLPLRSESVDFASALDVIEHLSDQEKGVQEALRVLRSGSKLFLNSPNRFSVMAPEDHCRLWFVGFLPYAWQAPYVRLRGRSYAGVRLLSNAAAESMLKRHAGLVLSAAAPFEKGASAISGAEMTIARFPFLRAALNNTWLRFVTPSVHFLVGRRV